MPQPPIIFPKLQVSSRPPELLSAPTALVAFSGLGPSQLTADSNPRQPMFRTKRKHVLKACDRCRVKKTKVESYQIYFCLIFPTTIRGVCSHIWLYSAMGTSHVIVAHRITTLASSANARSLRPKHTLEGEPTLSMPPDILPRPLVDQRRC